MEAKPFASLSSGLLARKGAARPAMRPQGFGQVGNGLEDLGWNDMGFEPPKPAEAPRDINHDAFGDDVVEHPRAHPTGLTPVHSPVHDQRAEIVERLNGEAPGEEELDETAEAFEALPEEVQSFEVQDEKPNEVSELDAHEVHDEPAHDIEEVLAHKIREVQAEEVQPEEVQPAPTVLATPVAIPSSLRRRGPRARVATGSKAKAAVTLRLDPDRHLKLRLACAVDGRSAQQLVTDALDHMLERMPELNGLAAKAKLRG